jgi:predicted signal transduction protein with EAL and GGDEF domain
MSTQLPKPIAAYIAGANARDAVAVAACFTTEAGVRDEKRERRGIAAILEWKEETEIKYQPVVDVIDVTEAAGKTIVTCKVSGRFPSSPVELKYALHAQRRKNRPP